ncbi:hypothetical protein SmJEL517_g04244 [Synchytrium microbalum]|uniref:Uncharacterized protein n=1 Tax=Synchytrium microbalum TaxID=1806994 RepID=A0A507C0X3_9FUNG|nr:uncharacterized protein SmJEL517_g04244 [Synchytrium microbalum]TPX32709.1 hypothetical protein SmJEL517_g04244 [Synchytrium microbalum]
MALTWKGFAIGHPSDDSKSTWTPRTIQLPVNASGGPEREICHVPSWTASDLEAEFMSLCSTLMADADKKPTPIQKGTLRYRTFSLYVEYREKSTRPSSGALVLAQDRALSIEKAQLVPFRTLNTGLLQIEVISKQSL